MTLACPRRTDWRARAAAQLRTAKSISTAVRRSAKAAFEADSALRQSTKWPVPGESCVPLHSSMSNDHDAGRAAAEASLARRRSARRLLAAGISEIAAPQAYRFSSLFK